MRLAQSDLDEKKPFAMSGGLSNQNTLKNYSFTQIEQTTGQKIPANAKYSAKYSLKI